MLTDSYQLAPVQQGMLFHWLLDRHSGTDVEQIVATLNEPIDIPRLERAWQSALDSMSTLRTAFSWEGLASPLQRIEPHAEVHVTFQDLRKLSAEGREAYLEDYLRSDRHDGFDLATAPAMRIAVLQTEDAQSRMVWSFHHILIDGRAFELILNHVFTVYDTGEAPHTENRPYREYIAWVTEQDQSANRQFWHRKLAGFTATTPLPFDPVDGNANGFSQRDADLPATITAKLRELATRAELSLNTIVMSAWALLLARYSGESDIVFGATKTTRRGTIANADSMVGVFLATVPVRITVPPDALVLDWLTQVRTEWRSLRGHEHLPLVDIKQVSELPSTASLFDTLVVFENYKFDTRLRSKGGAWAHRHFGLREQTGFPLTFLAYAEDALALRIEFDERRFHHATIDRMLEELTCILTAWSSDVAGRVWETPILADPERQQILVDWNATELEYPRDVPLAKLIEDQVGRTPDAIAVVHGEERLSYRELNARANRLARELVKHGAGPDKLVGICVDRSIGMMIALLAIVKSGAGYLPLDPFLPPDRLSYTMRDSGVATLITQESVRQSLPQFAGHVISIDGDADTWMLNNDTNLDVSVLPAQLGYVIYTSGSTGRPKGVELSRGSLINLLWSMRKWLALTESDRILAVTTISFDIAGADVWLPWLVGARTIIASRDQTADGDQLCALISRHNVTFLQATPVTWRLLLGAGWRGKDDMQIVCTGEAMPADLATRLVPIVHRLWNLYGPTETTIWSTGYHVKRGDEPILIGRPVANTRCYILDAYLQPVPIGAVGELYIAGDGLALGYRNRPDLTAEKFIPDPFHPGRKMYRTGDLARYHADGNIECLGRTDHQVKIRGFRIELGEIENLLKQHPAVAEAVVVAREDVPGDKRLVGYLVARQGPVDFMELRAYLKDSLPEYMIPAAFVSLASIPLTPNGKIDRKALPAPDENSITAHTARILPRTYIEKQLSEIWEETFSITQVSVEDDFFELGGHSLLALTMMAKITQVFGKQLPLNALFESPTIAKLAKHLEGDQKKVGQHTLVSIQATGSRPPIYWIPGGAALGLFRLRHIVSRLGPDQPVYGLGSSHPKSLQDVEGVELRAANYLELVRQVQPHGPYCIAGFCAGGRVAYEMAQRLRADGEEVAFVGMINCWFPNYPTGRIRLLRAKMQRLRHQLRTARAGDPMLIGYIRSKVQSRRNAAIERRKRAATRSQIEQSGFQTTDVVQNQVLLDATIQKFELYEPRHYPGRVSLFISEDEAVAGVSRDLDPRFAWTSHVASYEVRVFPGGHEAVLEMPYAITFAETLKAALDDALAPYQQKGGSAHP